MHVHEFGSPGMPAVVFLHGAGASGRMWRDHMARLGDRFHCLAPDLPGFGRSNHLRPLTVDETADPSRSSSRRASPRGGPTSWGSRGAAAWPTGCWAATRSWSTGRSSTVPASSPGGATPLFLLGITAVAPFLHTRPVMALFSRMIGMDEEGRADLRRASRRAFRRAFVEGFKGGISSVELGAQSPTLLTAGETETLVRPSNAAQAALMPHAEARFAPGLGHGWLARRTELHVRMVEAWLTGQELPAELGPEPASPGAVERMLRELGKEAPDADDRLAARPR